MSAINVSVANCQFSSLEKKVYWLVKASSNKFLVGMCINAQIEDGLHFLFKCDLFVTERKIFPVKYKDNMM